MKSRLLKILGILVVLCALILFGMLYARLLIIHQMYVMGGCIILICVSLMVKAHIQARQRRKFSSRNEKCFNVSGDAADKIS